MILLTNISHNGFTNYINGIHLLFFLFNGQIESRMVIIIIVCEAVVMPDCRKAGSISFVCIIFFQWS